MKPRPGDASVVFFLCSPPSIGGMADWAERSEWIKNRSLLSALLTCTCTHTHSPLKHTHEHTQVETGNLNQNAPKHSVSALTLAGSVSSGGLWTIAGA